MTNIIEIKVKTEEGTLDKNGNVNKESNINSPLANDFETAIDASGFGWFNLLLLLVAVPAASATVFETSTMSYILPSAECDLKLNLLDKGILNAITYAGMITSAIAWGYIADTKGRKKLLVFGYLADSICVVCGALSQNVVQLMIFKYLGGFLVCGPFAILMSYLNELHGKQYRPRVMMIVGMMFSTAQLLLPCLALTILPYKWNFLFFGLRFHSWQLFLAVSATPSLLSGLLLILFPESPKFLMSQGRNNEALEIFQKIYAINKHDSIENYPVKTLINEVPTKDKSPSTITTANIEDDKATAIEIRVKSKSLHNGWQQLRPLFMKPYLQYSLQVYLMNFLILFGQNTMRLWLPQLFASITEYEQLSTTSGPVSMCNILEYSVNKTTTVLKISDVNSTEICEVIITADSYTNNIIVALFGFGGYIIAGLLINYIGSKHLLTFGLLIPGTCGICLYWSSSSLSTLIMSALFVTMGSITSTSVISASVNLFPTSLRTMIVSLAMMFGRSGSILGNILFPMLITVGCIPPFLMLSLVMFSASILSIFLPNTSKASLK